MAENNDQQTFSCKQCQGIVERPDLPHTVRKCPSCGREMRIHQPGEHGKGIMLSPGEQFVIPPNWLTLSFNPLKHKGHFTRLGLDWFAKTIFIDGLFGKADIFEEVAVTLEQQMDRIVNESPLVKPLDVNNPTDSERILNALTQQQEKPELWAFLTAMFLASAREARDKKDVVRASWSTACAERCRMMLIFKEHLEEVVWMGQSAKRLLDALSTWEAHQTNNDEQFWQITFSEHTYVLSQVFAVPVVFLQEKAYVGGMKLDRKEAKFVDYLFSAESSKEAILVEIKTPASRLLGSEYRNGIYAPSSELVGAIVQVLSYREELVRNLRATTEGTQYSLKAFNPRCVLVVGNADSEIRDADARRSFELFRATTEVEIITYDELFRKVEILADLFGLKRARPRTK